MNAIQNGLSYWEQTPGVEAEQERARPSTRRPQPDGEQTPWYVPPESSMPRAQEQPRQNWSMPRTDQPHGGES